MTVSRTLAGGKNVRSDVQARVLDAARRLGYRRNETARSLRPGQLSGLVGVAITNIGNPYYGTFALGVEEVAAQHGRRIMLGNTGEDAGRERQLVADFVGRQVEGLIVVPTGDDGAHLRQEALSGVPLVLASRLVPGLEADSVLVDDVGGAFEGTRELLRAGHTRIAYLGNVASVFTGRRRFEGFLRALAEAGVTADPALVLREQQDAASAGAAMRHLLRLPAPPTAIFAANNRNTIGALTVLGAELREGRAVPELPSLASFDDFELAGLMPVPITVVRHDPRQLGREAARLLFERLERPDAPFSRLEMPTTVRALQALPGRAPAADPLAMAAVSSEPLS
jgi:LacI family transcriptional regulator